MNSPFPLRPMPEDTSSPLQNCPTCGSEVDVAQFEPLASVECPVCGSPMVVSKSLGQYELVEVMGRGGMGVVYRAIDHQLDRQVALKVLRNDFSDDPEFIRKLDEEAAITAGVNHPHVVKVYTTGTAGGRFYLAMELVDQGTLDDLLSVQGRVAESQSLEIASQIAQGLRAAHQAGLIHRDVKPGNILFSENHQAKIVDFGLAMLEEASKGTDEIWGTPYYVSPERLDQKPEDFRSDIYSLGATIFHAIAGRPPFEAQDASHVALKHLKNQAVSLQAFAPWVSGSTAFVINRTLNKDPAARYDSYDEFIEHLEYARHELTAKGSQPAAQKRVVVETDEDRKLWGQITFAVLALVLLLALGTGTYFLFFAPRDPAKQGSPLANSVQATGKHAADFENARKQLLANKPAEAASAFHAIAAESGTPQPMLQWSLTHEALSHLLAGSLPKARTALEALAKHRFTTNKPDARVLDDYFQKLAALIIDPKPSSATSLSDFNRENYGALAYLLAGLKDFELDDFENANSALRSFQMAKPAGDYVWIAEYAPLIEEYLADLSTYRGATMMAKSAKTQTDLQQAVTTLRKAKESLGRGAAKLAPKLEEAAVAAQTAQKSAPDDPASLLEKEKSTLNAAKMSVAESCKKWNFKEAATLLKNRPLKNSDLAREQRVLQRKVEWLEQFKAQLIRDLAKGYAGPMKLADNSTLSAPIVKATETGVEIAAAGAPEQRAWTALSPESICTMAESFITADLSPAAASERRWLLGVFALLDSQRTIARKNLMESAKGHPVYGDLVGLFLPGRRGDLARGKAVTVTASDSLEKEPPANAIDGKNETRWGSHTPGDKWLRFDFGKEVHVTRWMIRHGHSNNEPPETNTVDFTLQKSADDMTWTDVDPVQGNTADITDRRIARVYTRYLRVLVTKPNRLPNDNPTAHLYAVEIHGWEGAGDIVTDFFANPPYAAVPEFKSEDIGLTPTESSGNTWVDDRTGVFALRSGGAGLGPKGDAFRFVYKPLKGDGQIVVRFDSVDPVNPRAQAGVMVRDGMMADAACAWLGLASGGQLTWNVRQAAGGELAETREIGVSFPCWVKLESKGKTVSGSWSRDGQTWKPIGSAPFDFGTSAQIGLGVMSHTPKVSAGAKLEVINFLR